MLSSRNQRVLVSGSKEQDFPSRKRKQWCLVALSRALTCAGAFKPCLRFARRRSPSRFHLNRLNHLHRHTRVLPRRPRHRTGLFLPSILLARSPVSLTLRAPQRQARKGPLRPLLRRYPRLPLLLPRSTLRLLSLIRPESWSGSARNKLTWRLGNIS